MEIKKEIKRLNELELLKAVFARVDGFKNCADATDKAIETSLAWLNGKVVAQDSEITVKIKIYEEKHEA